MSGARSLPEGKIAMAARYCHGDFLVEQARYRMASLLLAFMFVLPQENDFPVASSFADTGKHWYSLLIFDEG